MNDKENYIKLVLSFLTGALLCYAVLGVRESAEIRQIKRQYEAAVEQSKLLSDQLEESRKRADRIQESIDSSQAGIEEARRELGNLKGRMRSDQEIIGDCERIINELRKDYERKNK